MLHLIRRVASSANFVCAHRRAKESQRVPSLHVQPGVDCRSAVCFVRYRKTDIPMDAWHVALDHVSRRFDRSSLYFCGFPTLQHIKHKVCVCVCAVYSLYTAMQYNHSNTVLVSVSLSSSSVQSPLVFQEEERGGRFPAEQQRGEHDAEYPPRPRRRAGELLFDCFFW